MRSIHLAAEVDDAIRRAARSHGGFGDGTSYVERLIDRPAPHRGADFGDHQEDCSPVRARVLGAASPSEGR
jgi:pyruvate carboxylase